jgi:hypothetical protein
MKQFALFILSVLLGGCAAVSPPRVRQVEFGRSIWAEGQRRAGVLFQDGAQAIPVEGGTLWTFGDTFIGKPQPGQPPQNPQITGAHWTTIALLPAGSTNLPPALEYFTDSTGVTACPLELFPEEDQKHCRMWPADGISLGSRIYLYYSMIETSDAPGPWNFHGIGAGLAVASQPLQRFTRLRPDGQWRFPVNPIQIVRENESLYLFEVSSNPKGLILARVSVAKVENPAAYEFFTGGKWSKNRAAAKVILREAYGQVSVAWVPAARQYVMATSSDFFHPREIQLRQSRRLEGPWSAPMRIAVPEVPGKKTSLVYCTFLHPELTGGNSPRLVVTFCRMLAGNWELCNPEYVTITLEPDSTPAR